MKNASAPAIANADPRPEIILHVGLDKTGTSALQEVFARNVPLLRDEGILYPFAGRGTTFQHHDLVSPISELTGAEHYNLSRKSFREHLTDLESEIAAFDGRSVLLSSEMLSQGVDMGELGRLRELCSSLTVVLYLRPQEDYFASVYRQKVKAGSEYGLFGQTRHPLGNFFDICIRWANFVGSGRLYVRQYDQRTFRNGSIVDDFFSTIGLNSLVDQLFIPERNANPRFTENCFEYKRLINATCPPVVHKHFLRPLLNLSKEVSPSSSDAFSRNDLLTQNAQARIANEFSASNDKAANAFLGKSNGMFEAKPRSKSPDLHYPGLTEDVANDITSYLADCVADMPVEPIVQAAAAEALSRIATRITRLVPHNLFDDADMGRRLSFASTFLRECASVKTSVTRSAVPGAMNRSVGPWETGQ